MECCPFVDAMRLLGRRYALPVIWVLKEPGPHRFNQIKRQLDVNPVTLSHRLSELEEAGIVQRAAHDDPRPRVEYSLTDKGLGLLPVLGALEQWSTQFTPHAATTPTGTQTG